MRFLHIPGFLIACIVIILVFPALAVKKKLGEDEYICRVWSVTDGDTLRCGDGKLFYRIRLAGIDAPEKNEDGWADAKNELAKMTLKNMDIILKFYNPDSTTESELNDPNDHYDQYGRVLAYVTLPDGKNANVEMVRSGWAEVSEKYPPKLFQKELNDAQDEAAKSLRGIWKQEVCVTETGEMYHPCDCHHLRKPKRKPITRAKAKERGLRRCSEW